jgi:hypothetical protein
VTGPGVRATSTSSLAIGTGSRAFATQANLAFSVGARVRATNTANTAQWMEGLVTAYSGTTLTVNMDLTNGSGTIASWNINAAGERGASGAAAAGGGRINSTSSVQIGTGSRTFTVPAGLEIRPGERFRINGTTPANPWMEGTVTSYSGTSLVLNIDMTSQHVGQTLANWWIDRWPVFDIGPQPSTQAHSYLVRRRARYTSGTSTSSASWATANLNNIARGSGVVLAIEQGGTNASTARQAAFQLGVGGAWKHIYSGTMFDFPAGFHPDSTVNVFVVTPVAGSSGFQWGVLGAAAGGTAIPATGGTAFSIVTAIRTSATVTQYRVLTMTEANTVVAVSFTANNATRRFTSAQHFNVFGMYVASSANY